MCLISSKKEAFYNIFPPHLIRYFKKGKHNPGKRYNLVQLFEHLAWKQRENLDGRVEKNSASTSLQGSRSISGGISLAVPGTMANLLRRAGFQRQNQEVHQVDNREKRNLYSSKHVWIEFGLSQFLFFLFKKTRDHLACHAKCAQSHQFSHFFPLRNVTWRN